MPIKRKNTLIFESVLVVSRVTTKRNEGHVSLLVIPTHGSVKPNSRVRNSKSPYHKN